MRWINLINKVALRGKPHNYERKKSLIQVNVNFLYDKFLQNGLFFI